MDSQQISQVLHFIRPNSEWILRDDDVSNLEWLTENEIAPTQNEIAEGWISYKAKLETDKIQAAEKRQSALTKLEALGLDEDDLKALGL